MARWKEVVEKFNEKLDKRVNFLSSPQGSSFNNVHQMLAEFFQLDLEIYIVSQNILHTWMSRELHHDCDLWGLEKREIN